MSSFVGHLNDRIHLSTSDVLLPDTDRRVSKVSVPPTLSLKEGKKKKVYLPRGVRVVGVRDRSEGVRNRR